MIKTAIVVIGGIIMFEFAVDIIKCILDSEESVYDYCYGCKHGFCTETPKTEKCKKWVDSKHDM